MRALGGLVLVGAVIGAAPVALAQGAAPSAFDGVYVGVSAQYMGNMQNRSGRGCPRFDVPRPLTISGGRSQLPWGGNTLQGEVNPQGVLTMHTGNGQVLTGQIDAQHVLRAQVNGACYYSLMWRRR